MYTSNTPIPEPNIFPPVIRTDFLTPLSKALQVYNGSIEFDKWLNYPGTTRSMIQLVEVVLRREHRWKEYLKNINSRAFESTRAKMMAQISVMKLTCNLREIYLKVKNDLYTSEKEYAKDFDRLNAIIHICSMGSHKEIRKIILQSHHPENLIYEIMWHFENYYNSFKIRKAISVLHREFCFQEFYNLMLSNVYSSDFLATYAISVLEKLNLIQLNNAYWTYKNCHVRMRNICKYLKKVMAFDKRFVFLQYTHILFCFLKKRDPKTDELHELYVAQKLYSGACFFTPLPVVINDLRKYEAGFNIEILIAGDSLIEIYPELIFYDFLWARRFLKPMIWVSHE